MLITHLLRYREIFVNILYNKADNLNQHSTYFVGCKRLVHPNIFKITVGFAFISILFVVAVAKRNFIDSPTHSCISIHHLQILLFSNGVFFFSLTVYIGILTVWMEYIL